MSKKSYATITWTVEDIKTLRPKWSDEQCLEFLINNQRHIQDRLIEHGWEIIESLIDYEESNENNI